MNERLKQAYANELAAARAATAAARFEQAFHHLERAHILSQQHTLQHVYVHWLMLRLALATGACREVFGQAVRVVAAAVFSRIWVPVGNTGRATVSALAPMAVPADLQRVLEPDAAGSVPCR